MVGRLLRGAFIMAHEAGEWEDRRLRRREFFSKNHPALDIQEISQ
jgi:hypothetical protein